MNGGFFSQIKSLADRTGPVGGSLGNTVALILVLTAGYFLLGRLAFAMAVSEGSATSIAFLPEGLALAFTIIFGSRVAPGIFAGQLILSLSLGVPVAVGASFGFVNMIEDTLGGWLFWKMRISPSLARPGDVARLFALSSLVLQPLAALAKAFPRLSISAPDEIFRLSLYSWAGNTMGQFLLVPLLLTGCCAGFRFVPRELLRSVLILGGYFLGILLFEIFRLGEIDRLYWLSIFGCYYLVLICNAVQSGTLTTSLTNFLTTMGFLWAIVASLDSLLYFSTQDRVLYADVLILGGVVTALIISALFSQLGERTAQLLQANKAKERLFAIIGHDLRSPIARLATALGMLKQGVMDREEFLSFREDLHAGVDQARWTLENLMEWGALQLNELQCLPSPVPVLPVVEETAALLRFHAEMKHIAVSLHVPREAVVWADRQQLASILRNLLSNAIKFTPEGGRVTISGSRVGERWKISVQDTGSGIPEEQAKALFRKDPAFSSTAGTAHEHGVGLGLRITRHFVEANGGAMAVERAIEGGSIFHVMLPLPVGMLPRKEI